MRVVNIAQVLQDGSQPPVPSSEEVIQSARQIEITRGEDVTITIALTYQNGDDVTFGVGDEASLAILNKTTDLVANLLVDATLSIDDGSVSFTITAAQSAGLQPGRQIGSVMATIATVNWAILRCVIVVQ